jgi:hypothetical protein
MDILSYLLPNQTWALSNHLAIAGTGGQPTYTWLDSPNSRIWNMKGASGYPWDSFSYDTNFVYQSITENVWTSPTTFKMFASGTWPAGNGGIAWLPRQVNPGEPTTPIVTADSTYRTYSACGTFTTANLGGPVETHVEGPYSIDFGGDLNYQEALVMTYKWNPGYSTMEVNCYVEDYGLVQWESYTLTSGRYVLSQTSLFNTELAGGCPALSFPCGVPTI